VSENFVGSVERGICSPSLTTLERIADALGVTLSELFDFPEEEAPPLRDTEQALKDLFLIARRARKGKRKKEKVPSSPLYPLSFILVHEEGKSVASSHKPR